MYLCPSGQDDTVVVMENIPYKNYCANCKTPLVGKSDKAKYCSEKCRKAYIRGLQKGADPDNPDTEKPTRTGLTRTDREFELFKPGYYNFSNKAWERKCIVCQKDYKTRLKLLKVCSRKCQKQMLNMLTGKV